LDNRKTIREANIVFVQVGGLGIFKRHSSKPNMVDKYYSTVDVIAFLNGENLKVCIVDRDDCLIEKNF
jgi:hypothetical protein